MGRNPQRSVVLKRDGVIIRRLTRGSIRSWSQVEFLPRALDGLRLLAKGHFGVLVIADRPCVGKGLLSAHELQRLTQRLLLEVALEHGRIDKVYCCPHTIRESCHCRVPARGLLRRALAEQGLRATDTYLIGDSVSDLAVGSALGCLGILLRRDAFLRPSIAEDAGHRVVTNLYEAVERILQRPADLGVMSQGGWRHLDFAHAAKPASSVSRNEQPLHHLPSAWAHQTGSVSMSALHSEGPDS